MNNLEHKTRLEIIRNNLIINTITPEFKEGVDDYEISSSSSVNSFPTLSIKSSNPEINAPFMGFSKTDIIRLSISSTPSNEFVTLFEGEFSKKETKFEAEPNKLTLEIDSIHSFFRLSILDFTSSKEFMGTSFGEFVHKLMDLASIHSRVTIDPELSATQIIGTSHNTNAFRLFKEVCLMLNAAVTFNTDNTVDIGLRAKKFDEIRTREAQTLDEKDIITLESRDSI